MAKKKEKPKLLSALEFVKMGQEDSGPAYKTHVKLCNGTVTANDGIITAGHLIDDQLDTVAHTGTLVKALKRCSSPLSILVNQNQSLTIRSNKFEAKIPCMGTAEIPVLWPDPMVGHLDQRFLDAAKAVLPITNTKAERLIASSILVNGGSVAATDNAVLVEYWHGIDMPKGLMVPCKFFDALQKIENRARIDKIPKELVGFGFSTGSFTVYYSDNSWVKTQLYNEKYPDITKILDQKLSLAPIPDGFFEAVEALSDFPEDKKLRLRLGRMQTHPTKLQGANYDVPGLTAIQTVRIKHLEIMSKLAEYMDAHSSDRAIFFSGANMRGCVSKIMEGVPDDEQPKDDDIPF